MPPLRLHLQRRWCRRMDRMALMVSTEGLAIGTAAVAIMAMVEGIGLVDAGSLGPWAAPSSAERSQQQQRPITTATRATRGTAISHGAGSISGGGRFASKHGRRGRLASLARWDRAPAYAKASAGRGNNEKARRCANKSTLPPSLRGTPKPPFSRAHNRRPRGEARETYLISQVFRSAGAGQAICMPPYPSDRGRPLREERRCAAV